jgi:hypothetical protein
VEWRPIGWHTGKRCFKYVLCGSSDFYLHSERQNYPHSKRVGVEPGSAR